MFDMFFWLVGCLFIFTDGIGMCRNHGQPVSSLGEGGKDIG